MLSDKELEEFARNTIRKVGYAPAYAKETVLITELKILLDKGSKAVPVHLSQASYDRMQRRITCLEGEVYELQSK